MYRPPFRKPHLFVKRLYLGEERVGGAGIDVGDVLLKRPMLLIGRFEEVCV